MKRLLWVLVCVGGVATAIGFAMMRARTDAPIATNATQQNTAATPTPATPAPLSKDRATPVQVAERIDAVLAQLVGSRDPQANRALLAELRRFLEGVPAEIASREVRQFLESKRDAATAIDVTVKPGGKLGDASSLRVFLLDYIGQVDRAAAGVVAAQSLAQYTTPDEWAVSLRNYAWANPGADGEAYL